MHAGPEVLLLERAHLNHPKTLERSCVEDPPLCKVNYVLEVVWHAALQRLPATVLGLPDFQARFKRSTTEKNT